MAIPAALVVQGTILVTQNINRVTISGFVITFTHSDQSTSDFNYQDAASAVSAFQNISAVMDAVQVGTPEIYTVTPSAVTALPQVITITGIAFDATAVIFLSSYGVNIALVTVFVNSTGLTATVAGATPVGTYDLVYSDSNGKTSRVSNGLMIY